MDTKVARADFLALVVLVAVACSCQRAEPQKVWYVEEAVASRLDVVKVRPFEEKMIREAASSLFTGQCGQAFEVAGLRSPYDLVTKGGVVIRLSSDLYIYTARDLGLVSEETRAVYAWEFSRGIAQGGTVSSGRQGQRLTVDGRPRIFLHDTAFLKESFWERRLSLRGVLIHEFIHAGGQPQTPGLFGPLRSDLEGFEHYGRIMEACK